MFLRVVVLVIVTSLTNLGVSATRQLSHLHTSTTIEQHPHHVSIHYFGRHVCSGALIGVNVVLTVANCTRYRLSKYFFIRAGSSAKNKFGMIVGVAQIRNHPYYSVSNHDYDVAVMLLSKALPVKEGIRPIPLNTRQVPSLTMGLVSGWSSRRRLRKLQAVKAVKTKKEHCVRQLIDNIAATDRMQCFAALRTNRFTCHPDIGAPLVIDNKLVGLRSDVHDICLANKTVPMVFTTLSHPNILKHIYGQDLD